MFCSATIESSVAHLINTHLKDPVRIAIGSTTQPAEHIDLLVYEVEQDRKRGLLETLLQRRAADTFLFARTKHGVDRLAENCALVDRRPHVHSWRSCSIPAQTSPCGISGRQL